MVQLGPQHVQDGWIRFHQSKTKMTVDLPMSPPQEISKATAVVGASTFPTMQYRKTFTAAGFANWFRDDRNETGLPHCSAHGVRKACTARAAENGATTKQPKAMFGWLS